MLALISKNRLCVVPLPDLSQCSFNFITAFLYTLSIFERVFSVCMWTCSPRPSPFHNRIPQFVWRYGNIRVGNRYLNYAPVVDDFLDCMTVSIACNGASDGAGQRCLTDRRFVGQLTALTWTIALGRLILLHVFSLLHQETLVESSWIAHRHITYI